MTTILRQVSVDSTEEKASSQLATKLLLGAASAGGAASALAFTAQPAAADPATNAIADISGMVDGLGGIATAALAVAIPPMAIMFAFGIIRRVMP